MVHGKGKAARRGAAMKGRGGDGGRVAGGPAADWRVPALAAFWGILLVALPVFGGKLEPWTEWATVAWAFAGLAALIALRPERPAALPRGAWAVFGAAVLAAAAMWASVAPYESVRAVLLLAACAGGLACGAALGGEAPWLGWALGAGGVVAGLWGLREYVFTAFLADPSWRPFGPFLNPNALAGYLLVGVPALAATTADLHRAAEDKLPGHPARVAWPVAGILAVCAAAALLLTASKGAFLAALAGLAVLGLVRGGRRRTYILGAVVVLVLTAAVIPSLRGRARAALTSEKGTSVAFRALTWAGTWRMARSRPLTGWGPGSFRHAYPRYAEVAFTPMAHSSWLQWWAESGLVSAALLVVGLAGLIAALARRHGAWAAAGVFALTALLAHNLVDYTWYLAPVAMSALVMAGLGLATRQAEAPAAVPAAPAAARGRGGLGRGPRLCVLACAIATCIALWYVTAEGLGARAQALVATPYREAAVATAVRAARLAGFSCGLWSDAGKMEESLAGEPPRAGPLLTAVSYHAASVAACPAEPAGCIGAARCLREAGQATAALRWARRAVRAYPQGPSALVEEARCLEAAGETAEALEVYGRVADLADAPYGRYAPLEGWADYHLAEGAAAVARSGVGGGEKLRQWRRAGRVLDAYLGWVGRYSESLVLSGRQDPALMTELRGLALEAAATLRTSADLADRELAQRLAKVGGS